MTDLGGLGGFDPLGVFPTEPVLQPIPLLAPVLGQRALNTPIDPNLQRNLQSLTRKWQAIGTTINSASPAAAGALLDLDRTRIAKGQMPLTKAQTARATQAIATGQLSTAPKSRSLWNLPGNALHDLANIVTSIPRVPGSLLAEARETPAGIQQSLAALSRGDIYGATQAPGVRMLPGAYVVGNVARGGEGLRELATHPLFSALDFTGAPGTGQVTKALRGAAADTRAARALRVVGEDLKGTKAVQVWQRAFSESTRDIIARPKNTIDMTLEAVLNPEARMPEMAWGRPELTKVMGPLTREAGQLIATYGEDFAREATQKAATGRWDLMTPDEQVYAAKANELGRQYASIVETELGELTTLNIPRADGTPGLEVFPVAQARQITRAQGLASRARTYTDLRAEVLAPTATADSLLDRARELAQSPTTAGVFGQGETGGISRAARAKQVELALTAADMAGQDTRALRRTLARGDLDAVVAGIDNLRAAPLAPLVTPDAMLAVVNRYGRSWTRAGELKEAITTGNWSRARALSQAILGNKKAVIPELAEFVDSMERYAARDRVLSRTTAFTERTTARLETRATEVLSKSAPARFREVVVGRAAEELATRVQTRAARGEIVLRPDDATREAILAAIMEKRYRDIGYADEAAWNAEWFDVRDGIQRTWQQLRDQGIEPVFLHRVGEGAARSIRFPRIGEVAIKPSSIKDATFDISPHVPDLGVALTHQGLEFLAREGSEHFAQSIVDSAGVRLRDLEAQYATEARALTDARPLSNYRENLRNLIERRYTAFNPADLGFNWESQRFNSMVADQTFIPRYLADAVKDYHSKGPTKLSAAWDPIMKVYRTSLLPLSPRWHTNNVIGGMLMLLGRADPTVLRDVFSMRQMMRDGTVPEHVAHILDVTGGAEAKFLAESSYMSGRTMGRIHRQILESSPSWVKRAGTRAGGVLDWSYALNQHVDNIYRGAALLYGERRALRRAGRKGQDISVTDARLAGLELMNKVMPEWAAMTGIERTIMRQVFPFYAFTGHMLRYVTKYPADHPVRAAIMGSIARAELDDLGTGLPEQFLSIFRFGKPDAQGNQRAFSVGAMNPFQDIPSYFTTLGWASAMNPLLTTAVEQLGFADGQVEAYPMLQWDAQQGRLVAKQPGLLSSFVFNTIPQTELLAMFAGGSTDFRKMMAENPEAAMRRVYALGGIPIANYRTVNTAQAIAKNELAVEEDQATARKEALSSGDWAPARAYPELDQFFTRLQGLPPETLAQYQLDPAELDSTVTDLYARLSGAPATQPAQRTQNAVALRRHQAGGV